MSLRGVRRLTDNEAISMDRKYYIYILTNKLNSVLYTGVTNNLKRRVYEHKNKLIKGFTDRYKITKLVYYEEFGYIDEAILREKQIKGGSRNKKIELIKNINPVFKNLAEEWHKDIEIASSLPPATLRVALRAGRSSQ